MFDELGSLIVTSFEGQSGTIWRIHATYYKEREWWDTWLDITTGECMDCKRSVLERMYKEKKIKLVSDEKMGIN